MTTRRTFLTAAPSVGAMLALGPALMRRSPARAQDTGPAGPVWHCPSLREETVTALKGAITTFDAAAANERLAMTEKRTTEITPDV